ncbi:exonuclease/endonuclease/phosphatase family protein [Sphingomonas qomolangmaensis]|uniref:Endonuclease/exonuclease/phosphatase domain-containing protein n=1 Tax=Sphingomonas qomolangmaensis TaxID=2918765 RepID=A0ABY5L3W9_9SPHN|nr:hypothetical protein [Sphingomonas qomolangmaensis]UUL81492.1 hypothetical protein NMP03_09735 [Sphingomonas qomolangmaensis]
MATIRFLSWNIQVYGPKKYGQSANNANLAYLVGAMIAHTGAQVVLLQELMTSIAEAVAFTAAETCAIATGKQWRYIVLQTRPEKDRESYAILFQSQDAKFAPIANGFGIASGDFPTKDLTKGGRRPAYVYFRTTDTNTVFVATSYHAPPSGNTSLGVKRLGQMPEIYSINPGGTGVLNTNSRVMGGDYNMPLPLNADLYAWLTDPVPVPPPPTTAGQGAGSVAAVGDPTILATWAEVTKAWGDDPRNWHADPAWYVQKDNCLDNLFCRPAATRGGVVDALGILMDTGSGPSRFAQKFITQKDGSEQFPHASMLGYPMNKWLQSAPYAYIFYRNAVSDHLPVWADVTI